MLRACLGPAVFGVGFSEADLKCVCACACVCVINSLSFGVCVLFRSTDLEVCVCVGG